MAMASFLHVHLRSKKICWSAVQDWQFVGSDLTFPTPAKTDGPVESVQLRTLIK